MEERRFSQIEIEKIESAYKWIFPKYEEQFLRLQNYLPPIEIYADFAELLHYHIEDKNPNTAHFEKLFKAELQDLLNPYIEDFLSGTWVSTRLRRKFVDHLKDLKTEKASASIDDNIKEALKRAFEELQTAAATTLGTGF